MVCGLGQVPDALGLSFLIRLMVSIIVPLELDKLSDLWQVN